MAVFFDQSNSRYTSLVEIIALVVIIFIVGWFFVRPQASALGEQRASLKQAQTEFQNVEQNKRDLAQLANRLKAADSDIALVDEALPLHNRPTQLQVLLEGLVTAAGMRIVDLSFQPVENSIAAGDKTTLDNVYGVSRQVDFTTFDMGVTGNIDQLKNLLELIESNGRIVDISTISLSNDQESTLFKLKLKAYNYVP